LIRDRDAKFTAASGAVFTAVGTPILITGGRHLRLVLGEYADHYNIHRPHRTLQQNPPAGREHPLREEMGRRILRRDRLGGLIHEYAQVV
jgi:hypothetical protein